MTGSIAAKAPPLAAAAALARSLTENAAAAELLLRELEARGWRESDSGGGLVLLTAEETEGMP